jgi:hypothetical protein
VFNDVHVAPYGQDERPLVFDGEATNVILRNVAAVGKRPQGFDECTGGIVAGDRICCGDIEGAVVWGPNTRYVWEWGMGRWRKSGRAPPKGGMLCDSDMSSCEYGQHLASLVFFSAAD